MPPFQKHVLMWSCHWPLWNTTWNPLTSLLTNNSFKICGKGHFVKQEHELNIIQKLSSKLVKVNNLISISLACALFHFKSTLLGHLMNTLITHYILQNVLKIPSECTVQDVMKTIYANWDPGQKPTENINTLLEASF